MQKYSYKYEKTPNYCYKDSETLINKFDIKDENILFDFERRYTAIREAELLENPIKGNFDFDHLKALHKFLFQDVYYWAGDIRTCNIAKTDLFCLTQNIESFANSVFESLKEKNYFIEFSYEDKIKYLTSLFSDINALHPFREGNGRTQREFLFMLARINGIEMNINSITPREMIEASHLANNGHEEMMYNLLSNVSSKIDKKEQLQYIQKYIKSTKIKTKLKDIIKNQ